MLGTPFPIRPRSRRNALMTERPTLFASVPRARAVLIVLLLGMTGPVQDAKCDPYWVGRWQPWWGA